MWGNKAPGPFKLCIKGTYVKLSKKRSEQRFKNALIVGQWLKVLTIPGGKGTLPVMAYIYEEALPEIKVVPFTGLSLYKGIEIS